MAEEHNLFLHGRVAAILQPVGEWRMGAVIMITVGESGRDTKCVCVCVCVCGVLKRALPIEPETSQICPDGSHSHHRRQQRPAGPRDLESVSSPRDLSVCTVSPVQET